MSSITSSSSTSSASKVQPGFASNLDELQVYRLKEAWLILLQFTGRAPATAKVGVPMPKVQAAPVKQSKFSFRSQPAPEPESYTISHSIAEFKQALGSVKPAQAEEIFRSTCRSDHPDILLLRFLRARKWEMPKVMQQFGATMHWRLQDWNIDTMLERGEEYYIDEQPDPGFINQYKDGKVTLHGHDKQGRPLVFIHVAKHDPKAQSSEAMERYTLHVIECARLCLSHDVNTAAVVFDLGGFGLGNMDYHVVKFILTCFEKFYPECLGYLFIHRAPWVFSSVWNIIKGWIDPVVASKISFTKNEKDLLKFIDADQIPKDLGGTSPFTYKWIPPVEGESKFVNDKETRAEKLKERNGLFDEFEKATIEWIAAPNKEESAKIFAAREQIFEKIYDQYWTLDPYIRARTIADRNGSLGEFKPQLQSGNVAQPTL